MSLPENFMTKYLEKAKESTIFGEKLDDLTRDELIAAAAAGWYQYERLLKDRSRSRLNNFVVPY